MFSIEKYHITDSIDVSFLPMLVRRKLSKLDKIVFSTLNKIYEDDVDNIIFASENGEFDRLKEIIIQYKNENSVSPIKFSSSVHNYSPAAYSQLNKITNSYLALSAGKESLASAVVAAIIQPETKTCVVYADEIGVGMIISTKSNGYEFNQIRTESDTTDDFIEFLGGNKDFWNLGYGVIKRV